MVYRSEHVMTGYSLAAFNTPESNGCHAVEFQNRSGDKLVDQHCGVGIVAMATDVRQTVVERNRIPATIKTRHIVLHLANELHMHVAAEILRFYVGTENLAAERNPVYPSQKKTENGAQCYYLGYIHLTVALLVP